MELSDIALPDILHFALILIKIAETGVGCRDIRKDNDEESKRKNVLNREGVPETESTLMRQTAPKFTSESVPEVLCCHGSI